MHSGRLLREGSSNDLSRGIHWYNNDCASLFQHQPLDTKHLYLQNSWLVCHPNQSFHLIIPSLLIPLCVWRCLRAQVGVLILPDVCCSACRVRCMLHWNGSKQLYTQPNSVDSLCTFWFSEHQPVRDFWRHVHPSWHHFSVCECTFICSTGCRDQLQFPEKENTNPNALHTHVSLLFCLK